MQSEAQQFLDLYKQMEYIARTIYYPKSSQGDNVIGKLMNHNQFKRYKEDINYLRVVRNFLTHNPKVDGEYPLYPSQSMIRLLEKLIDLMKQPPLATEIAIKRKHLFSVNPDETIGTLMQAMNTYGYGVIPIIEKGRLVGIFTSKSIYACMCQNQQLAVSFDTPVHFFEPYYQLDTLQDMFAFVDENATIEAVESLFYESYGQGLMLRGVFITKNGTAAAPIIGLVTPWDLLIDI